MRQKTLTLCLLLFGIVACDIESPYSGYQAYFYCDASFSPFNQIFGAGQFITIKRRSHSSYEVTDVFGNKQIKELTELEARQGYYYGFGGFIVGTPSMGDGNVWAYDWACPNCDVTVHRLELSDIGHATCHNCGAVFDLNSGGIPIEGKSRTLWRYKVLQAGNNITIQN